MEWNLADIIKSCKKQDAQAQLVLFHHYKKQLLGLCIRYVNNREVAEEVLMDAFVIIFKTIKSQKGASFESWMKSIVVHKAIDYFRKHKNDPAFEEIEYVLDKKVEQHQSEQLELDELVKLLQCLPVGYRMVFNLFTIEGFHHHEIAEKLGISVNTSKSQLHKAKLKLQEILQKGGYHG